MNSTALDRPYQAERTAEQTPRANGRGTCQAVLFIFIVMCFFNCIITEYGYEVLPTRNTL